MACIGSKPKREFKSTALKKLSDIFQGFVDSLADETCFNSVLDVVVNRDHKRELTHRLKTVENLVKRIREQVPDIQESLTVCDEILSLACANFPSQEDVMCALRTGSDVGVGGASNSNTECKAVNKRRARPGRRGTTCRHHCSQHQEVMDHTLWRKLPREVVQHICAFLPFSKTLELQRSCKPWSRMPMATNFRQSCAKAHDDLFGILIDYDFDSYRIAVSNSMHTEWFYLEIKDMPGDRYGWNESDEVLFAHDGGFVCILLSSFIRFGFMGEPPSISVFNPLTGDERDIPLSSFTCSKDMNVTEAILLQLVVDSETGCYELVLVTESGKYGKYSREGNIYCSERYDSKSKLWSTLDSGFVFGDGVVDNQRCEVYFDCCSKQLCRFDGQPLEDEALESNPESLTIVRDHRFEIDYVDHVGENYRDHRLLEISESVWENGWLTRSTKRFPMEEPPNGLTTRLFASQRYVLVVADDMPSDVFEHRHQRMLLFDRKTRKAAYDIPNFWRENDEDHGGTGFLGCKVHVMCDLKWNVVP